MEKADGWLQALQRDAAAKRASPPPPTLLTPSSATPPTTTPTTTTINEAGATAGGGRGGTVKALLTRPVLVKNVLSAEDIAELDALYAEVRDEERVASDGGSTECFKHPNLNDALRDSAHHTCFLNVNRLIDERLPRILAKVLAVMRDADRDMEWGAHMGWGVLRDVEHNVRVCEYHDYTTGGEVCDPRHCDGGSLVTSSILLTPQSSFTGGEFTMLEADEETVTEFPDFERGDALIFVSEKWHSVEVVESGQRCTLVTELWGGPRCLSGRNF
tara:strand:- start:127 stop:945 length:819 start_codon:yes stop_codon:yes gene_type:complete